jgi:hypothetical protein
LFGAVQSDQITRSLMNLEYQMEVQYQCNMADYKEALVTHRRKPLKRKILETLLAWALIIFGTFVFVSLGARQGAASLAVIITLFFLWIGYRLVVLPLWIGRDFRRHPNFVREQLLRIDEEGLHSKSEIGQSEKKWLAYTEHRETQNLFILHLGARLFEVIPKRAFSSTQLDEFRKLLRTKLPTGTSSSRYGSANVSPTLP